MKNKINQLKQNLASIHWPSKKDLTKDTTVCVITSVILATLIALWSSAIESIVNFVVSKI
jgi:preprotein translocase SecE subunit